VAPRAYSPGSFAKSPQSRRDVAPQSETPLALFFPPIDDVYRVVQERKETTFRRAFVGQK
jgi:hypothetical protein